MVGPATTLPRVVLAAPSSGSGKTLLSMGLMVSCTRRGLAVSPHKVGPDYIDPGYHGAACGRPGRNLDVHLVGEELITPLLLHGARTPVPADIALIEGVMGLFDGSMGGRGRGSTAHVAHLTSSPVILVVSCAAMARSVGAIVHGFSRFDADVRIAGVVLNHVASPRHEKEVRAAVADTGIPVVGAVPRLSEMDVPSRHLGLVTAAEHDQLPLVLEAAGAAVDRYLDVDAILELARQAAPLEATPWDPQGALDPSAPTAEPVTVAVAGGSAFTFSYPETHELIVAAGAEVVNLDPLHDTALPPHCAGLIVGGGFPEVHAPALSANSELRERIAAFASRGGPIVGECAGLLYLLDALDGHPMSAVVPGTAGMTRKLTLGYRTAVGLTDGLLIRAGERVRGHEFHRTQVTYASTHPHADAWGWQDNDGQPTTEGRTIASLHASYLHTHWAGYPQHAQRFVAACRSFLAQQVPA